ncbi:MAG: HAD-IA family hydrolase [Elainellaceae cyanobacterium]
MDLRLKGRSGDRPFSFRGLSIVVIASLWYRRHGKSLTHPCSKIVSFMLKAILYDLDGTLADTDPVHFQTWRQILREHDLEIDLDFYQKNFSGRMNPDIVRDLLPSLTEAEGRVLSDRKEALFREQAQQSLQPLAGLLDLIAWGNRHHLHQVIVTNAPQLNAEFMIETLQFSQTFEFVVLGDDLPHGKPHPLPYQTALDQLDIDAKQAITFEDSPSGIRSSVAAGIETIGITTTHSPEALQNLGAAIAIEDFTDERLMPILQKRLKHTRITPSD